MKFAELGASASTTATTGAGGLGVDLVAALVARLVVVRVVVATRVARARVAHAAIVRLGAHARWQPNSATATGRARHRRRSRI